MKKLTLSVISLILLVIMLACGCAANNGADAAQDGEDSARSGERTVTVQVKSIDGNSITAVVGELKEMNLQKPENGEAPEMPEGGEMPEMPEDGEMPEMPEGGEMPQMPEDGEMPEMPEDGEMPEMPEGGMSPFTAGDETVTFAVSDSTSITVNSNGTEESGNISDIAVDSILTVTISSDNTAVSIAVQSFGGMGTPGGFGGSAEVTNGTSANTIDTNKSIRDESYTSSGNDENALRIDKATVSLSDISVEKTGGESSDTESGDFYGLNAALLALNGAQVTISGAAVNTSAVNGNGVFSYGDGTVVNISDSTIRTTERNSGGIQTTGGGTTNASDLDIVTQGASSAAIRSDRGGGTVNVDGGSYVTNGTGSPAIYSTANIAVKNAVLTANASEAIVVEGKNSVALTDCTLTSDMQGTYNDESENIHSVMLYQSMSGDAEIGNSSFSMTGGSITSKNGDLIYVTNTSSDIYLSGVTITMPDGALLRVEGNSSSRGWGTSGKNGGTVTFTADAQTMSGDITVDDISSLALTMRGKTKFTGSINASGAAGEVKVLLDDSVWELTADSYITSFDGDLGNIVANGFHLYVDGVSVI